MQFFCFFLFFWNFYFWKFLNNKLKKKKQRVQLQGPRRKTKKRKKQKTQNPKEKKNIKKTYSVVCRRSLASESSKRRVYWNLRFFLGSFHQTVTRDLCGFFLITERNWRAIFWERFFWERLCKTWNTHFWESFLRELDNESFSFGFLCSATPSEHQHPRFESKSDRLLLVERWCVRSKVLCCVQAFSSTLRAFFLKDRFSPRFQNHHKKSLLRILFFFEIRSLSFSSQIYLAPSEWNDVLPSPSSFSTCDPSLYLCSREWQEDQQDSRVADFESFSSVKVKGFCVIPLFGSRTTKNQFRNNNNKQDPFYVFFSSLFF